MANMNGSHRKDLKSYVSHRETAGQIFKDRAGNRFDALRDISEGDDGEEDASFTRVKSKEELAQEKSLRQEEKLVAKAQGDVEDLSRGPTQKDSLAVEYIAVDTAGVPKEEGFTGQSLMK